MAYVDMTVMMMEQFGVRVIKRENPLSFDIKAGSAYEAIDYDIEPDLSAACYFYAMSPVLNVSSQVRGGKKSRMLTGRYSFSGCTVADGM